MTQPTPQSFASFDELGIAPKLLEITRNLKFTHPTPIQHQAIPVAVEGKDVIGIAQTGTGKTLAFGIPMIQQLATGTGRGLVVLPTRELAYQVEESLRPFAAAFGINMAVFVGGASMNLQLGMLRKNPRILVATPGRLNDHLEQGTVTLREVSVLVLDEADRMLDMGFKPQIDRILAHVPKQRQTMLFSATMPKEILQLATREMRHPLRIEVAPAGTAAERVEQELFVVEKAEKIRLLEKLLTEYKGTVLVFSRTKHGAKKITRVLKALGHSAAEIHANRSLAQRREALEGFKSGRYRVLVATDIAARGIDVTGIEVVINYDLPDDPADYVHRIGRTARAGREGKAVSFASPDQVANVRDIEKLIRTTLPRGNLPTLPAARAEHRAEAPRESGHHGRHQGGRGGGGRGQHGSRGSRGGGGHRHAAPHHAPAQSISVQPAPVTNTFLPFGPVSGGAGAGSFAAGTANQQLQPQPQKRFGRGNSRGKQHHARGKSAYDRGQGYLRENPEGGETGGMALGPDELKPVIDPSL